MDYGKMVLHQGLYPTIAGGIPLVLSRVLYRIYRLWCDDFTVKITYSQEGNLIIMAIFFSLVT